MLLKKLRVQPGAPLVILGLPKDCVPLFEDGEYKTTAPRTGALDQLIFFAKDAAAIREKFVPLVARLSDDALVWVMYPKKSGAIKSDLSMTEGWAPAFATGLTTVASAAVNENWSAFRLRPERLVKGALAPVEARSNEHIDYVKRTVVLPDDAARAVQAHPGMIDVFQALAFTHRKEHVVAILDAKKPETRERRIRKMIETLAVQMKKAGSGSNA